MPLSISIDGQGHFYCFPDTCCVFRNDRRFRTVSPIFQALQGLVDILPAVAFFGLFSLISDTFRRLVEMLCLVLT